MHPAHRLHDTFTLGSRNPTRPGRRGTTQILGISSSIFLILSTVSFGKYHHKESSNPDRIHQALCWTFLAVAIALAVLASLA